LGCERSSSSKAIVASAAAAQTAAVLGGLSFSTRAASWSAHGDAGSGSSMLQDGAMNVYIKSLTAGLATRRGLKREPKTMRTGVLKSRYV
jgi:hypothetical protein